MTTSAAPQEQRQPGGPRQRPAWWRLVRGFCRLPFVRELLIFLTFCLFSSTLTWPYVMRMRDAVVDPGDPYLIAWVLWWDYHQTFTNPLHLFDANVFYPLKYSLAFTEHSYGIAVLFFPLFALGAKPLTVHAVAMYLGFAFCGYGAFRLGRTLTGSNLVGWVAGIAFAFVPYRFQLMSQLPYLFSAWIPLVFEAVVLFVRERSRKRAAWLGCAFFMSGITTISWFNLSLIPLVVFTAVMLTRYDLWRDRAFWRRGAIAVGAAAVMLLPFMVPYVLASRLYGFKRSIAEIQANSAWPIHWLSVENRNRLWNRMGAAIPDGWKFKLFPGLLPILFSVAALLVPAVTPQLIDPSTHEPGFSKRRWVRRLDLLFVIALGLSILAIGFDGTDAFRKVFTKWVTSERALSLLTVVVIARLCLAYPRLLRHENANLIESMRSKRRGDAFWLGTLLTVIGFCYSLGWNFFFYRICYDLLPIFRSMRVVTRGAMFAYLGLALLAGVGVKRLGAQIAARFPRLRAGMVGTIACGLLLCELNAAPLTYMRGEIKPDAVTQRLKQTSMKGGVVVLPAGGGFNYRYMLRAADHQKPLIVGTSGFNSPIEDKIEILTSSGAISMELLDLFETVPASYVVIETQSIAPERKTDYQEFLARAITTGRLRFINRFDGHSDLYAVVKIEPEAASEASLLIDTSIRDWSAKLHEDPVNLLGQHLARSQRLYRVYFATSGVLPRYTQFIGDLEVLGRGVGLGAGTQDQQFEANLHRFLGGWIHGQAFGKAFGGLDNEQYVDRLITNVGISIPPAERAGLVAGLANGQETRATVLAKIIDEPGFIEKEKYRSLLLLHYFGYLRRNPEDQPDGDLRGFNFWLADMERSYDPAKLSAAFRLTGEYHQFEKKP